MESRKNEVDKMRDIMGTKSLTTSDKNKAPETKFYEGVEGINVSLVDWPKNPYKAMYVIATSTWGDHIDKWKETPVEGRIQVVRAALTMNALPLSLEAPKFTFAMENMSRAAFDQLARARIGTVFGSVGVRDNDWRDCAIRIPQTIADDPAVCRMFVDEIARIKNVYSKINGKKVTTKY